MMINTYDELAADLLSRCEAGVEQVCRIAVETGISFKVADIVRAVEDKLPDSYPEPAETGIEGRRQMIQRVVQDIITGEMYEDA